MPGDNQTTGGRGVGPPGDGSDGAAARMVSVAGRVRVWEIFAAFLKLGLTSFGGPVAHIGYFRREFVERRRWLDDTEFGRLLALCQFLPGPASSQLGFSIGLVRGGLGGAAAAFVAFTLPSAVLLFAVASLLPGLSGDVRESATHGLKLVAVAVVANGVLGMARQLCPDAPRATIAALAAALVLVIGRPWIQVVVVALGAASGLLVCRNIQPPPETALRLPYGGRTGVALLVVFGVLLLALPVAARLWNDLWSVAAGFYRSGALVFGGGHVVLPLLRDAVVAPGWISNDDFLAGYGAAQAVPGPMFTVSAFLGERLQHGMGGFAGATVALLAIFLPGLLLVAATLPLWRSIGHTPRAARAVAGVNATVVGLLAAALYDPVWTSGITSPIDVAIAGVAFTLLTAWRASPLMVVLWCVAARGLIMLSM
jgi:chromate transporter